MRRKVTKMRKSCEKRVRSKERGVPLQTTDGLVDGIPHHILLLAKREHKRGRNEQDPTSSRCEISRERREREKRASRFFPSFPTSVPFISSGSTSRSITDKSRDLTAATSHSTPLHLFKLFPTISLSNNSI